jgi:protein SCO1/2
MKKNRLWIYVGFFALLLAGFYWAISKEHPFTDSKLAVLNNSIPEFNFITQDNKPFTPKNTLDKVYVAEYFFTTCRGICPKMNTNMRRVFEKFKDEKEFMIVSHTCMPEVDSVPLLKAYERKMINGSLVKNEDGSYKILNQPQDSLKPITNPNWVFVTGDKAALYKLARQGYMIDNGKPDSVQIKDQFIHTQFFSLVDKNGRVRGIYDGLVEKEVKKLMEDIPDLLKEKVDHSRFLNGFSNSPY